MQIKFDKPVWVTNVTANHLEPVTINGVQAQRVVPQQDYPLSPEELNSMEWTVSPFPSHQEQIQGLKEMFFPRSTLGGNSKIGEAVQAMDKEMDSLCDRFFEGELSANDLADAFQRLAEGFLSACRENGYPLSSLGDGMDEVKLSVAYDHFRERILSSAVRHNNAEGKQYASEQGGAFRYYNGKYYHKSEEAIGAITGRVQDMAAERGMERFEIPDYEALGLYTHRNFNTAVSGHSNVIPGGLTMVEDQWITDYDMVPPEDFRFFYQPGVTTQGLVESEPDAPVTEGMSAQVWVSFRSRAGMMETLSREFTFSVTGLLDSDQKNLADLLQFTPASKKEFAAMNKFLRNFQVTPPHYSYFRSMERGLNVRA